MLGSCDESVTMSWGIVEEIVKIIKKQQRKLAAASCRTMQKRRGEIAWLDSIFICGAVRDVKKRRKTTSNRTFIIARLYATNVEKICRFSTKNLKKEKRQRGKRCLFDQSVLYRSKPRTKKRRVKVEICPWAVWKRGKPQPYWCVYYSKNIQKKCREKVEEI